MIKDGMACSPVFLTEDGWENTGVIFGGYQIWKKDKKRLFFDFGEKIVYKIFDIG